MLIMKNCIDKDAIVSENNKNNFPHLYKLL